MDVALKVTDQPQESSFFDMVSGDSVLSIPLFQRAYQWSQRNLDWLLADVADIRNEITKSCFLGVVVCVNRGASPGRPIPWEIVDGQQRLSTLYLLLLAATEVGARNGASSWAAGVMGTYLLVRPLADNPVNTKLVPSFADRDQFKRIWDGIAEIEPLANEPSVIANRPRPPAPSGPETGAMLSQYNRMRRRLSETRSEFGQEALERVVEILAQKLSVVSISLRDPLVAPKIFERLNNRAELVTVADLVRNEVFARVSIDPTQAVHVFTNYWEPFNARFARVENGLEKFLFPYGLLINRSLTKADLFAKITNHWSEKTPTEIIADMQQYAGTFLALEAGQPEIELIPSLQERVDRIHRLGKPSSTFSFIIRLIAAVRNGEVTADAAVGVLDVIECFLFRRAICGKEPTGLHAVFKGLWHDLAEEEGAPGVSLESIRRIISSKPTIDWPSSSEFEAAIRSGDLYHRKVAAYALREYETACEGESPSDEFQIEHVCPQSATTHWRGVFQTRYEDLLNTWANLFPLTGRMNNHAGQEPFSIKREEYANSIFASTRAVAASYSVWTPVEVDERADQLVTWALQRWPFERS